MGFLRLSSVLPDSVGGPDVGEAGAPAPDLAATKTKPESTEPGERNARVRTPVMTNYLLLLSLSGDDLF